MIKTHPINCNAIKANYAAAKANQKSEKEKITKNTIIGLKNLKMTMPQMIESRSEQRGSKSEKASQQPSSHIEIKI